MTHVSGAHDNGSSASENALIECVPNFSEGRDPLIVAEIARAAESVTGAWLLDATSDPDHHRTVLTIAGEPMAVLEAAIAAVRVAIERIDLGAHAGVHPRIGAADVIPFVPVRNISLTECAELARRAARGLWEELRVPSFLYEAAAIHDERMRLENVRRIARWGAAPDVGEGRHSTAGASAIGARSFLIAWNINLRTPHAAFARQIARSIRESSGGLPAVKALGLPLGSRGESQVSINLVDFRRTPLHLIFEAVEAKCRDCGIEIAGSELIGMIPEAALEGSSGYDLHWLNFRPELVLERRLRKIGALK